MKKIDLSDTSIKGFKENHFMMLALLSQDIPLNPIKTKILLYLLKNINKEKTISDISRDLKIDYKNTRRYVEYFNNKGIVKLNPEKPSQGKKVLVSINQGYGWKIGNDLPLTLRDIKKSKVTRESAKD